MPSGCRMGICMACVLPLKEGAVRDLRNGASDRRRPGETGPGRRTDPDLHQARPPGRATSTTVVEVPERGTSKEPRNR